MSRIKDVIRKTPTGLLTDSVDNLVSEKLRTSTSDTLMRVFDSIMVCGAGYSSGMANE
ncbi:TPA: hypothetical protein ACLFOO_004355 [Yersinia enterocolitica]|nr:hypothetical protein [Yersinia enterocolitica]HDL8230373.1 hypothetical protein [Yersinia enterocolitica]HDX8417492.1 hypothetical protein [Yersinia enterocolitica]HEN3429662.1 hypothetical protein [Yersinia enterocolitica]